MATPARVPRIAATRLTAVLLAGLAIDPGAAAAAPPLSTGPAAEEILDRLRVPEELRETAEAERLVEDEGRKHRPPLPRTEEVDEPRESFGTREASAGIAHPLRPLWRFLPRLIVQSSQTRRARSGTRERDTQFLVLADFPLGPVAPAGQAAVPEPDGGADPIGSAPTPKVAADNPEPGRAARHSPTTVTALRGGVPACLAGLRDAALAAAFGDPQRLRSLASRARKSALLPELRFRVERRLGRNESLDLDEALGIAPLGLDTVDDVRYEARAIWDLGRLVFAPEELAAQMQAVRLAEARRELASRVNRLFFERRTLRALLRFDTAPGIEDDDGWPAAVKRELRLAEADAELETLTGGLSGACL